MKLFEISETNNTIYRIHTSTEPLGYTIVYVSAIIYLKLITRMMHPDETLNVSGSDDPKHIIRNIIKESNIKDMVKEGKAAYKQAKEDGSIDKAKNAKRCKCKSEVKEEQNSAQNVERNYKVQLKMKKYDIFISYRREGGYDTAKHLSDLLTRDGYRVSFDIDTLRSGDFDTQLYERIDLCKDFILIVDKQAFDRTIIDKIPHEKDWLRCELAYALEKGKNIIPIFLSGVKEFPDGLPCDISGVTKKNGPEYNRYYFNDFYRELKKRFLYKRKSLKRTFGYIILVILCIIGIVINYPTPKLGYKYKETNEFVENINKWNSLKSFKDNAGKEGNKYMTWYIENVNKKDMAQNKEFGEVYLKYFVIKPLVLAYVAFSTSDLEAEQDADYINDIIEDCYKSIPDNHKNALSFNANKKEERIESLKSDLDICIQKLQKRKDLTKMQDDHIPLLKATIITSFWGN